MVLFASTFPDTESIAYYKARYHYLLQILFGETLASDYCRRMSAFAPNHAATKYLLQQQTEEDAHLEMLTDYVGSNPRPQALISPHLLKLHEMMSEAIGAKDYEACIFIQNFIVEGVNISFLRELEHHADGKLSELCSKILADEVGHMEFGVTEIKRILEQNKSKNLRKKFNRLQRKIFYHFLGLVPMLVRESKDIGIPATEFAKKALEEHLDRIAQAHYPLPLIDKVLAYTLLFFISW